jgi:hypothetical protein
MYDVKMHRPIIMHISSTFAAENWCDFSAASSPLIDDGAGAVLFIGDGVGA